MTDIVHTPIEIIHSPFTDPDDNRIGVKSGWVDEQHIDEIKDQTPRALRGE